MADAASSPNSDDYVPMQTKHSLDTMEPHVNAIIDGRSVLGFSLTSPDLVICAGDSPEICDGSRYKYSFEVSLENGIPKTQKSPVIKFSPIFQTFNKQLSSESSLELFPKKLAKERLPVPGVSINAGSTDIPVVLDGVTFLEDTCFAGGDTVRTNATIGDGYSLYQTARCGNFSYCFSWLGPGNYAVTFHFAEIVFADGPPRMRLFDIFMQDKKVVSCLDIYAQVGANKPLVISDLKTSVYGEEGLSIRFEGVMGSPIVCGISIDRDSSAEAWEAQLLKPMEISPEVERVSPKIEKGKQEVEGDILKLLRHVEYQRRELTEMRRALEELKRENQLKNMECQDAWKSLEELQNELMRKSMHVGSLAFAIEGQVKEKSRWFSSLRDVTRKIKLMKMEHIKLSEEALAFKRCLADMDEMRSIIQCTMKQHVDLQEDFKTKFIEGAKERKELYNKVLELKGNIKVFCRSRPLNAEELALGALMAIDFESSKDGELTVTSNRLPRKTFKFDAVFNPQASQADIFEDTVPFATSVLDGYNVCIFAYGQTGTGKTFTMEGTEEARGVNFRILDEIFHIIKERDKQIQYEVCVSVLEVYNEQIRDLLVSASQPGLAAKRLEIRQVGEGLCHVPGLVEAHVNNVSEAWEVLRSGSNARAVGSTNANEHSSRSHCIHCVMVKGENLLNGDCTRSKLWLVDLAGSERVAKSEVQGERLKETQNINRSLSALGDVISALATKSPHIPFRNSKLTHLLQDSLGGDSKTLMFVQISPNEDDLSETLCSLNFASRVRGIELGPAKRQLDTTELLQYKQMAEKLKLDLKSKDTRIKKMEETQYGLDMRVKEKDLRTKNLQEKVKELELQLLIERKLARQHVDAKIAEQQQQKKKEQQDEQPYAPPRAPLASGLSESKQNFNEPATVKEQVNSSKLLVQNYSYRPTFPLFPTDGIVKCIDPTEKENNPEMAEQPQLPKKTGRASICTTAQRFLVAPAPRRTSLVTLPRLPGSTLVPVPLSNADIKECTEEFETNCSLEQAHCTSPKATKHGTRKLSNILRRSLQRKVQMKSPVQQHLKKGVINVGMEKVRVSIGSRKVLLGNGRRVGMKDTQNRSQREKERGWNIGTVGRTAI